VPRIRLALAPLLLCLLALGAGCGTASNGAGGGRTPVVAAFYPLAFAAEQIGGRTIDVRNLTPAGAEPHDIELTPKDVAEIQDARAVFYLGNGFQPAVEDAARGARGDAVDLLKGLDLHNDDGKADPHVWLDPTLYAKLATRIGATLSRNPAPFRRRLAALDAEYRRGLADCRRREIVTSHAAFGYLALRYGLKQIAISGLDPEAEPSARHLAELADLVRRDGATTIFTESLLSPEVAETVAREAGVTTTTLNPIEGLTKDQQDSEADYFSLMRQNLGALRSALGCR
jgi:zinc transport system substrate-binding protein